jgi:hypothetical protein
VDRSPFPQTGELARLTEWLRGLSAAKGRALTQAGENETDDDPHRLVDYAS